LTIAHSETQGEKFEYTYLNEDIRTSNFNGRTLQSFSTLASQEMRLCPQCAFYPDYQQFVDYYGDEAYADKWVLAAFHNTTTQFTAGRGDAHFGHSKAALAEAISRGVVSMHVYMKVIQKLERSIVDCLAGCRDGECSSDKSNALDAALALYAGSLEGKDGSGEGYMLYSLADRRAIDFRTAGYTGDKESGTAYVNSEIVREMKRAQKVLSQLKCNDVIVHKEAIVNLMKVPLVQSVLRAANIRQYDPLAAKENLQAIEVEGATYTAAILPYIHHCNPKDAAVLYSSMMVGSHAADVNFSLIKSILERNYDCLGVTCNQVGGLWSVDDYSPGAEPCTFAPGTTAALPVQSQASPTSSQAKKRGGTFMIILGTTLMLALAFIALMRVRRSRRSKHSYRPPSRNIAAVSEIA
jgi:hypothetical protein